MLSLSIHYYYQFFMATLKAKSSLKDFRIPKVAMIIATVLIFVLSIGIRLLPLGNVITDNTVQLKGADAYYFVRQAQNIQNGGLPEVDPLLCYQDGISYDQGSSFYSVLLALFGSIFPIEFVTAAITPLLALAFLVIIYFLIKELLPDNDWALLTGLAVAGLSGIQFISRSYFGFGDRHALEVLLFSLGLFALIKAWRSSQLKWGVIAGISFFLYNYSWSQASMLIAILTGGVLLKYVFDEKLSKNFTLNNIIVFGFPLLHGLIFQNAQVVAISFAAVVMFMFSNYINKKFAKRLVRGGFILLALLISTAFVYFALPALWGQILIVLNGYLNLNNGGPIVSEAQPMFVIYNNIKIFPPNAVTMQIVIFAFSILGFWALMKSKHYALVFTGVVLAILSLMRIRTEYYFIIFSAIGAAFLVTETKKFAKMLLFFVLIFVVVYSFAWVSDLRNNVSSLAFTSSDYKMANWMKENLPDSGVPLAGNYSEGQKAEYGVLNDWQLGYLYSYIANKPLLSHPNFCNSTLPIDFFLMTDENEAYQYAKSLGIKYVLVKEMDLNKYFYYLAQLDRQSEYGMVTGTLDKVKYVFINPLYYQRMVTRMYTFDGLAYEPKSIITIDESKTLNEFFSYEEAAATNPNAYYSIEPEMSPLPLEELKHFKLIQSFTDENGGVKLFEVID